MPKRTIFAVSDIFTALFRIHFGAQSIRLYGKRYPASSRSLRRYVREVIELQSAEIFALPPEREVPIPGNHGKRLSHIIEKQEKSKDSGNAE